MTGPVVSGGIPRQLLVGRKATVAPKKGVMPPQFAKNAAKKVAAAKAAPAKVAAAHARGRGHTAALKAK